MNLKNMLNNLYINILKFFGIYKQSLMKVIDKPTRTKNGWEYPAKVVEENYYFFGIKYKTKKY